MIKQRLFVKGETLYLLLSSHTHPNILLPAKGIVMDIKHDEINPQYLVRVTRFFDDFLFLKKYFFKMSFSAKIGQRARRIQLDPTKIKTHEMLQEKLSGKNRESYYFVVDSIMTVKFRGELQNLFNKIQNHLIEKQFHENREYMTRRYYKGVYKLTGQAEYNSRLKYLVGDKIEAKGMEFDLFTRLL